MKMPKLLSSFLGDTEVKYLLYHGPGPTIVFVHAAGFNPWLWHPIARELAGQYRIVAPFFCDHKSSELQNGGLRWPILANDLVRLLDHLEVVRPIMVGHSMGGGICILTHGIIENLSQKMVLIEPIVFSDIAYKELPDIWEHPLASRAIGRKAAWNDQKEAESYLRDKKLFKNWDDEMMKIYLTHGLTPEDSGEHRLACSPQGEAALFMGSFAKNPLPLLPKIACPVLVLEGEHSESHLYLNLPKITQTFPNGEYLLVSNTGHLIPMEKPNQVLKILQQFL